MLVDHPNLRDIWEACIAHYEPTGAYLFFLFFQYPWAASDDRVPRLPDYSLEMIGIKYLKICGAQIRAANLS